MKLLLFEGAEPEATVLPSGSLTVNERLSIEQRPTQSDFAETATRIPCGSSCPGSAAFPSGVKVNVMCDAANAGTAVPIERAVRVPATARDPRRRLSFIVRAPPFELGLVDGRSILLLRDFSSLLGYFCLYFSLVLPDHFASTAATSPRHPGPCSSWRRARRGRPGAGVRFPPGCGCSS